MGWLHLPTSVLSGMWSAEYLNLNYNYRATHRDVLPLLQNCRPRVVLSLILDNRTGTAMSQAEPPAAGKERRTE